MTKYFVGAVGALLGALGGVWLMVAPFILAYQPEGADWADPSFVDFWTGLPLVVVSIFGFAVFLRSLVGEMGDRGILERGQPPTTPQAKETYNQQDGVLVQALAPLLAEMTKDLQEQRGLNGGEGAGRGDEAASGRANRHLDPERSA